MGGRKSISKGHIGPAAAPSLRREDDDGQLTAVLLIFGFGDVRHEFQPEKTVQ